MNIASQLTEYKTVGIPKNQVAFFALALGILIMSLSAILTKILMADLSPEAIIFNRFWVASLTLGGFYWVRETMLSGDRKEDRPQDPLTLTDWLLLIGSGVCLAGTLMTWAWSFDHTTVAHSCLLHYQNPIFTTLGAWLLFGQSFDRKFLIGLTLTVAGASIVSLEDLQWSQGTLFGDGIALLSGLLFSAELLIIERLRDKLSTLAVTTGACVFSCLFALPFALFSAFSQTSPLFPPSLSSWLLIIILGFIVQVLGHFLFYYSLKQVSSGFAAIALMLDISISAFLAWIIFVERLTLLDWISLPVLFWGIYLAKSGKGGDKCDLPTPKATATN